MKDETIDSRNGGMTWVVVDTVDGIYTVKCPDCGFILEYKKSQIRDCETCPKCQPKPAAIKTDDNGNCITICDIGMVEFILDYRDKHQASERAAVRAFLGAVKAHLPDDDPILSDLSEESVRAGTRRKTGKKSDPGNIGAVRPKELKTNKIKRYTIKATPESVGRFLNKYLPDYTLISKTEAA